MPINLFVVIYYENGASHLIKFLYNVFLLNMDASLNFKKKAGIGGLVDFLGQVRLT